MKRFYSTLASLALSAGAGAQTLSWTTYSESVRPTAQDPFGVHGEHSRPPSWRPLLASGAFDLRVTVDYDISVTSTRPTPLLADFELELSDAFVTNTVCWGIDATFPSRYPIFSETVPGNSTVRYINSVLLHARTVPFFGCAPAAGDDSIHLAPNPSFVVAGPVRDQVLSTDWLTDPFSPAGLFLSFVDEGSVIRNDLGFTTVHELPLVASSTGCEPLLPNSTGVNGTLEAFGVVSTSETSLVLNAAQLPATGFCLFALSRVAQPATLTTFGVSTLCLGSPAFRWLNTVGMTDSAGGYQYVLDPAVLPTAVGPIVPGDSLYLQLFHRDVDPMSGGATANSTNAIQLTF